MSRDAPVFKAPIDFLAQFRLDTTQYELSSAKDKLDELRRDRDNLRRLLDAERAAHERTKDELAQMRGITRRGK